MDLIGIVIGMVFTMEHIFIFGLHFHGFCDLYLDCVFMTIVIACSDTLLKDKAVNDFLSRSMHALRR
jgi:hypothetical protein